MLLVLEDKLGLAELQRDALKSFIETVFTDPQKILQVQDLDNRVRSLEKQTNRLWIAGGLLAVLKLRSWRWRSRPERMRSTTHPRREAVRSRSRSGQPGGLPAVDRLPR
jgi:hypothetical protein